MKLGTHALIYFRITKPLHPEYHFGSEIFYMNHASFVVRKGASFKVTLSKSLHICTVTLRKIF